MSESKKVYKALPRIVHVTLSVSNGWLVGGAVRDILAGKDPKDFDIVVPDRALYQNAVQYLTVILGPPTVNSNGGLKFGNRVDSIEIDIWCQELSGFIAGALNFDYLYNAKRYTLIKKV